jgi:hypothetical protein
MSETKKITITKEDVSLPKPPPTSGRRSLKTFPKGILKKTARLKLKGVSDPAKSPPLKQGMRKHTLRMFTSKGLSKHRKTLKQKIKNMNPEQIDAVLKGSSLKLGSETPKNIKDQILENAISAGFISM